MKKRRKTLPILALAIAVMVGGVLGGVAIDKAHSEGRIEYPWESSSKASGAPSSSSAPSEGGVDPETTINASGVVLQSVSSGTDSSGNETRTLSYRVTPSDSTDQTVSMALLWTDKTVTDRVSDYVTYAADAPSRTIVMTFLKDFAHQITFKVSAVNDPAKFASMTIDCLKRFRGWREYGALDPADKPIDVMNAVPPCPKWDQAFSEYFNYFVPTGFDKLGVNVFSRSISRFSNGESAVYSKDPGLSYSATLGAATGYSLAMINNYPDIYGYSAGDHFWEEMALPDSPVALGDAFGPGRENDSSAIEAAVQAAVTALPAATKASIYTDPESLDASNATKTYIGYIGFKASTTIDLECSDGQKASYKATAYFLAYSSNYDIS